MAEGFQVLNDNNIVQVDSTFMNQKLLWSGTVSAQRYGGSLSLAGIIDPMVECPLIFVRTTGMFGGVSIRRTNSPDPASFIYYSSAPVDVAIFSTTAPDSPENAGIQVFNASGQVVYSSSNKYARIQDIAILNGSSPSGTASFAPQSSRPWICANPITFSLETPLGSGSEISFPPYILAATYTNSSITYSMPESYDILSSTKAPDARLSPYNGRTLQIPIGIIPGL